MKSKLHVIIEPFNNVFICTIISPLRNTGVSELFVSLFVFFFQMRSTHDTYTQACLHPPDKSVSAGGVP